MIIISFVNAILKLSVNFKNEEHCSTRNVLDTKRVPVQTVLGKYKY